LQVAAWNTSVLHSASGLREGSDMDDSHHRARHISTVKRTWLLHMLPERLNGSAGRAGILAHPRSSTQAAVAGSMAADHV
jgi:hypothetical protein